MGGALRFECAQMADRKEEDPSRKITQGRSFPGRAGVRCESELHRQGGKSRKSKQTLKRGRKRQDVTTHSIKKRGNLRQFGAGRADERVEPLRTPFC